jgi:hypothetical protein
MANWKKIDVDLFEHPTIYQTFDIRKQEAVLALPATYFYRATHLAKCESSPTGTNNTLLHCCGIAYVIQSALTLRYYPTARRALAAAFSFQCQLLGSH